MNKKIIIMLALLMILAGTFYMLEGLDLTSDEEYEVSQIIDGDTVKLINGEKVRLIGINAPETGQPYAEESKEKLDQLIGNAIIKLKRDVDKKDRYGRWLRYVYVGETFVNLEMVNQGYATAYSISPNLKYSDDFENAEQEALDNEIGMWTPSSFEISITSLNADAKGDDADNLNGEYVVLENLGTMPLNLTGWRLYDEANNEYVFPNFHLVNGSTVTIFTGSGTDNYEELYWCSSKPVWNNDGDSLYIRDAEGFFVVHHRY